MRVFAAMIAVNLIIHKSNYLHILAFAAMIAANYKILKHAFKLR
jgi:hypothetical protein